MLRSCSRRPSGREGRRCIPGSARLWQHRRTGVAECDARFFACCPLAVAGLLAALGLRSAQVADDLIPCVAYLAELAYRDVKPDLVEIECDAVKVDREYPGLVVTDRHARTAGDLSRPRERTRPRAAMR